MSLSDAVGKLQGLLSSFATEETKKSDNNEKVEDSSVFSSSISEFNEEADITGIEIGYSQAENEVSEQLYINKEIYKNNSEAEKFKERVSTELENANIPEALKDELAPLYAQLCESTDVTQREYISAKIKQICLESEKEGVDASYLENVDLNLQLDSMMASNSASLSELYQQLSEVSSPKEKDKINAEIRQKQSEYEKEMNDLKSKILMSEVKNNGYSKLNNILENSDLPIEAKDLFVEKYSALIESENIEQRDKSLAELKQVVHELNHEYSFDPYGQVMRNIELNEIETRSNIELVSLYEQLSETVDANERDRINAEIKKTSLEFEQESKILSFQSWMIDEQAGLIDKVNEMISSSNLPDELKKELSTQFDDFVSSFNQDERDYELAQFQQKLLWASAECGIDISEIRLEILKSNSSLNSKIEIAKLNEELSKATSADERDRINAKIKITSLEFERESKILSFQSWMIDEQAGLKDKVNEMISSSNLPDELKKELSTQFDAFVSSFNQDERDYVLAQFQQKLLSASAEYGIDISEIRLEILKSNSSLNNKIEIAKLNDELSNATSADERDRINAKIIQKQLEYQHEMDALSRKNSH